MVRAAASISGSVWRSVVRVVGGAGGQGKRKTGLGRTELVVRVLSSVVNYMTRLAKVQGEIEGIRARMRSGKAAKRSTHVNRVSLA